MATIYEKLTNIQSTLKAPKGQYNSFGKYKYRSCEDILEAVKPLLAKEGLVMTIADDVLFIGPRFYIKATVTVTDGETSITNTALAREEDTKKGMDGSQVTGTASSYARKYALNGMFLIDDTKDADTDEFRHQRQEQKAKAESEEKAEKARSENLDKKRGEILAKQLDEQGISLSVIRKRFGVSKLDDLTHADEVDIIANQDLLKVASICEAEGISMNVEALKPAQIRKILADPEENLIKPYQRKLAEEA